MYQITCVSVQVLLFLTDYVQISVSFKQNVEVIHGFKMYVYILLVSVTYLVWQCLSCTCPPFLKEKW